MVDSMYSITVLVYLAVLAYIFYQHYILKLNTRTYHDFNLVLIVSGVFVFVDCVWGIFASGAIAHRATLSFFTYLFHVSGVMMAYSWFRYTFRYLELEGSKIKTFFSYIPVMLVLVLLFTNPKLQTVFTYDRQLAYQAGKFRAVLFLLEYGYFIMASLCVLLKRYSEDDRFKKARLNVVLSYSLILLATGFLQFLSSKLPWYSIGALFAGIVAFVGNVLIERENDLKQKYSYYMAESKEMNEAMTAMADSYLSIHVIKLEENTSYRIRSGSGEEPGEETPSDGADAEIKNVMNAIVHPSMVKDILRFVDFSTLARRLKGKHAISREFMDVDEKWRLSSFITVQTDVSDNPLKIIHAVQDIDDAKRKEMEYQEALKEALENQNVIYSEMLKMQAGGIVAVDNEGSIIVCNDVAAKMFGYKKAEEVQDKFRTLLEEKAEFDDLEQFKEDINRVMNKGGDCSYSFSLQTAKGTTMYVLANAKDYVLKNGNRVLITSLTDITTNREMEKKLLILSETDALTGINNRGSGEQKTIMALEKGMGGMFCLIDANRFKNINDTYGHQVGDKALIAIAEALSNSFRDEDVVMRLGGDEFAVFASSVNEKKIGEECIGRFFDRIDAIDIPEMNGNKIAVSLGAVFSQDLDDKSFSSLYSKADSVMYLCKDNKEHCSMAFYEVH